MQRWTLADRGWDTRGSMGIPAFSGKAAKGTGGSNRFREGNVRLLATLQPPLLNEDTEEAPLCLICGVDDFGLRAWLAVRQSPDVWATQEFEKLVDGDWRLRAGAAQWSDSSGALIAARGHAKLDSHVKRLPALLQLHRNTAGPGDELVVALDGAAFGPKTRRGRQSDSAASPRNREGRKRQRMGTLALGPYEPQSEAETKAWPVLWPASRGSRSAP
jgi:hypothetical protein